MINVDFLNYIVEFSKTQNLTKASEELSISQSALTRAMKKLEDDIGVTLFIRSKNKLLLNDTGNEFVKYAKKVLDAQEEMMTATRAFDNSLSHVSVGLTAPGPMLKYGNVFYSAFPNMSIETKIDEPSRLLKGLSTGVYDVLFTNEGVKAGGLLSSYVFTESLHVFVPKTHFVSGLTDGVKFSDIDGQSFLVANELGLWDKMIKKHLPNSKFFTQDFENLSEIINASTIPTFSTNVTIPLREDSDRVDIKILDDDASVDFYIIYRAKDKSKLSKLLQMIGVK